MIFWGKLVGGGRRFLPGHCVLGGLAPNLRLEKLVPSIGTLNVHPFSKYAVDGSASRIRISEDLTNAMHKIQFLRSNFWATGGG